MYIISALVAVVLIGALFVVHVGLHKENDCHMTFMWRHISLMPFNVAGNNVRTYKLVRYIEGFVNEKTLARSPTDIPVLFIPGSGGSANQVRSVASIMMNKTEMKSAPFRMHFYAVDFNEELSFLSGSTVIRQRDFVMKAITRVQRMYTRKIILIGHSFGGTVVHALPAAAGFDVSQLGLIITLAAPLVAPPILMDETMVAFYESMNSSWISRREELRHVGLVSYSGGSKDFQVPDHLAAFPGSHVVHRPSWSIRGVDTAADHLCILWCNQLTRHSTRVLYSYGMEQMKSSKPRSPRAVVKEFFRQERISSERKSEEQTDDAELNFDESAMVCSPVKIGLFDYPWVSRTYRGTLEESQKTFELQFPSPYSVYSVSLNSSCGATLLFTYTDSISRASVQRGDNQVMVIDRPYFLNITAAKIVMKGKPNCEYDLSVRPDVFHTWYLVLISNAQLFLHVSFSVCMILAVIEKLRGSESKGFRLQSGFYSNGATICAVFFCFTYNVWILECIFAATLFYLLFLINILSTIFVFAKDLVHSSAPFVIHLSCLSINLVVLFLLTFNIHLANAAVAVFMIVRRSSGPYAVTLSIWVAVICTALGLTGPSRVHVEQFFTSLLNIDLLDTSAVLNLISENIDVSNIFLTPVVFYMLSRFLVFVQPPKYIASLKDFFLVVLLAVPCFTFIHISLSLEASAVAASFLLTILSLL
ncbi:hypothetical protein Q1695_002554 [Nippostrongylus brasiliensis]|nr:hypothetical protein Q1695_002554 [Nippostrongylus brasiliensis]